MMTTNDFAVRLKRGVLQGATTKHRTLKTKANAGWIFFFLVLLFLTSCASNVRIKEESLTHMRLGDSLLREGRPTQALAELTKASELDPNNPEIRNILGIAYMEKEMIPQAINQFEKALYLKPNYSEVHNNLGIALLREKKVQEAIKEFNKALENPLYSTPHFAHYNLGQAYFALGDFEKSKENYQEAIKYSPSYSLAYHGLGQAWKALGDLKQAAEAFKKAIEHAPKYAQAHYDLGEVLVELHQTSLAVLAFKEVINLVPDSELGEKARQRLKELK